MRNISIIFIITAILTFATDFRELTLDWVVVVIIVCVVVVVSISEWEGTIWDALVLTSDLSFITAPVITVESLTFAYGPVVIVEWVILCSFTGVFAMEFATVFFLNAFVALVSLADNISWNTFVFTLLVILVY